MRVKLHVLFLTFLLLAPAAFAQTGKISGFVKDAQTGEALIGANVVIENTSLGAATDLEGFYTILNVPPGTYKMKASNIGYAPTSIIDVRVNIDQTTQLNFNMTATTLQTSEVVVVAETPIVQKDVSSSGVNLDVSEIKTLPVVSAERVVTLQAGIQQDDYGRPVIRGGDANQTAFMVNGISMRDGRDNAPYTGISFTSVEQIQVTTGGFNAEYGDIRSGLVNVVTKEGDVAKYNFSFLGRYSPTTQKHFGGSPNDFDSYYMRSFLDDAVAWTGTTNGNWDEYTQQQYAVFEGWNKVSERTLSDNDPTNDLTPAAAQRLFLWQHRRNLDIDEPDWDYDMSFSGPVPVIGKMLGNMRFLASYRAATEMYVVPLSRDRYNDFNASLKLTSDVGTGMKLMVEGIYGKQFGTVDNITGQPGLFRSASSIANELSVGSSIGTSFLDTRMFAINYWTPSEITRFNIGAKFTHALSANTYYEVTANTFTSEYNTIPGRLRDTSRVYQFGDSYYVDEAPYGFYTKTSSSIDGMRMSTGMSVARDSSKVSYYKVKFDLTSQLDKYNNLKTGFEFTYTDNRTNFANYDEAFKNTSTFSRWNTFPLQGSFYIQDKLEFEAMIANIGVRIDYSDPNVMWYDYSTYDLGLSSQSGGNLAATLKQVEVDPQVTISPRLGVAFPITENSKLFFNYGHFRTLPTPDNLYMIRYENTGKLTRIADPENPLQKTVAYELGYEQNLMDQFLIRVAGYYKDVTNETRLINFHNKDSKVDYSVYEPNVYRDIRGFEATFTRNRGDWARGFINYTYSVSTSGKFGWGDYYENNTKQRDYEATTDYQKQDKPIPRPYARMNVDLFTPMEFGPKFANNYLLGDWHLNILASWTNGRYATWTGTGSIPGITNNVQWRDTWNIDMRVSKNFEVGPVSVEMFAQISNVFNIKNFSSYGFVSKADQDAYMKSLHLSKDVFEDFPKNSDGSINVGYANSTDGTYVFGDDKPGDYRTGEYHAWDPSADEATKAQWKDNKSYIDMPNQSYFTFMNPRDIYWGLRLNVTL